jgi:hypothetical protein
MMKAFKFSTLRPLHLSNGKLRTMFLAKIPALYRASPLSPQEEEEDDVLSFFCLCHRNLCKSSSMQLMIRLSGSFDFSKDFVASMLHS